MNIRKCLRLEVIKQKNKNDLISTFTIQYNGGWRVINNEELCKERHDKIKETFDQHNNRLNKHSDEIHELQQVSSARTTEVSSMCKSIDSLNKRIDKIIEQNRNLLITVMITLVGFFLTMIQKGIFK